MNSLADSAPIAITTGKRHNWKYEAGAAAAMRFWAGLKERYYEEGLSAPAGARCPYVKTSFAANHWRRGNEAKAKIE